MTTPRWIGLTGRAGSGKSFVGSRIAAAGSHTALHFAWELRHELQDILGVENAPGLWTKPTSPEVRWLLQQYGTNYRRSQNTNYWSDKAMERAEALDRPIVFDDVRFTNEAAAIQKHGGLIVRVLAPIETRKKRLGTLPPEHPSETDMDKFSVDMHITSTEDNLAFEGQLSRILVEATYDESSYLQAIAESLEGRS